MYLLSQAPPESRTSPAPAPDSPMALKPRPRLFVVSLVVFALWIGYMAIISVQG
jgi:hypothetical protein